MAERPFFLKNPWAWVPTLYFAEGIPYVLVMTASVIFYKRMGVSNAKIALYTSWLYLPWVIKPLWSPFVDLYKTKRSWILGAQLLVGAGLGGVALTAPLPGFFQWTLLFFWLLAFSSATHDIAADGFYMLALSQHDQAFFVGIRSTFYRFAMIAGQGLLVMLAGFLETHTGLPPVDVTLTARPGTGAPAGLDPKNLHTIPAQKGALRILAFPKSLSFPAGAADPAETDALPARARSWNMRKGFVRAGGEENGKASSATPAGNSWWERSVSLPLGKFLRKYFGPEKKDAALKAKGNLAVLGFSLNRPPEKRKTVAVTVTRSGGPRGIALVEGERFTFSPENRSFPALAVFQADPKIRKPIEVTFTARAGNIPLAWSITFFLAAGLFLLFYLYHRFVLPRPPGDGPAPRRPGAGILEEFGRTFVLFFKKKDIFSILAFLLLYRLGEAQLAKLASPFLLDPRGAGGLGLSTAAVGFAYGTVGVLALIAGGVLGGIAASRKGLKFWLWWMAVAINLPDAVYIYLSYAQPDNAVVIYTCIAVEQFGYGFGFTAYMLFMIYASRGPYRTAHFALTTGFMALGMMLPGMISGWIQENIGYQHFFIWVMIATVPAFLACAFVEIDPEFGKKEET